MFLSWFSTKSADAFVDELVAAVVASAPVASLDAGGRSGAKSEAKLRKSHDLALQRAAQFAREQRPNFYQKAHLANRFKWALREAKYPGWFVDEFAYELAAVLAAARSEREV